MKKNISTFYQLQQGFTLLELIVVLSLIGIAAGLVLPRLTGGDSTRLQAEVRELVAVLNYARRMALIQGQETTVKLYPPKKNTIDDAASVARRTHPGEWYSQGVSIESKGTKASHDDEKQQALYEVHFYPGGGSSGGDFVLKTGEISARISIDALTGKLKAAFEDE